MAEQAPAKRRGNPNWTKGGPSPNPNGRPRSGLASAERIREMLPPEEWITATLAVARDEKRAWGERQAAYLSLIDRGYVKPPVGLDAHLHGDSTPDVDWSKVPLEVRRAELERQRALLAQYACSESSGVSPVDTPAISDGSASSCNEPSGDGGVTP